MSGLVLKLAPRERVLVNGAVIENGERRTRFSILTPNANILRLRDALHPDEVDTPVRRVCYITQLVLSGDAETDEARGQILRGIEQLGTAFQDDAAISALDVAAMNILQGDYYRALKSLRLLIPIEARLLAHRLPEEEPCSSP